MPAPSERQFIIELQRFDKRLDNLDAKLTKLLRRRTSKDSAERTRRNQRVGQLGDQIKQMKVEKIALLNYIRELEGALRVQREGEEL